MQPKLPEKISLDKESIWKVHLAETDLEGDDRLLVVKQR